MISLIAYWWIQSGHEKEVISALKKLAVDVHKNEPDTLSYKIHLPNFGDGNPHHVSTPVPRPGTVIFEESYRDWAAFDAHIACPTFQNFMKDYGHLFVQAEKEGPFIQVVFLDEVAGFTR